MLGQEETVYVVDDDSSVRRSLDLLFRSVGLEAQTFTDGRHFLDAGEPKHPGCILLDLRMPAMSGLQVQAALRARGNDVPIVFISAHADVPVAVQAMKEGAADLLEKPFSEPVLLETVQRVVERDRARRLQHAEKAAARGTLARLTGREMEVVRSVAKGKSSKEIAAEMRISRRTVEVHRCRAIRKAGARNTAELVQMLTRLPQPHPEPVSPTLSSRESDDTSP